MLPANTELLEMSKATHLCVRVGKSGQGRKKKWYNSTQSWQVTMAAKKLKPVSVGMKMDILVPGAKHPNYTQYHDFDYLKIRSLEVLNRSLKGTDLKTQKVIIYKEMCYEIW